MTTALAAVLVLLNGAASAADMVAGALEVIRMTGGTKRLVLREAPRDRAADRIAVAGGASGISPVIARVIAPWIVAESVRRPGVC